MILLSYLIAGAAAGFIAGLFGVGGGIIMVPVFILCFQAQGFDAAVLTHMAVATSLACIVFTSLSSTRKHYQLGAVDKAVLFRVAPGIMLGAVFGVLIALRLNGDALQVLLGLFVIAVALKMNMSSSEPIPEKKLATKTLFPAGTLIGAVSALFGIGGGTLSVPYFLRLGLPMGRVVGTAAACGLPIAFAGAIANIVFTLDSPLTPEHSWGYIYLPAVLIVSAVSMVFARFGAMTAQRMNADRLKKIFSVCLFAIGIKFVFL